MENQTTAPPDPATSTLPRHRRVVLLNRRTDCWRTWHNATVTQDLDTFTIAGEKFAPRPAVVADLEIGRDNSADALLGDIAARHGLDDIEAERAARSWHRDGDDCGVCRLDLRRAAPTAEQIEDHAHWLRAACARLFDSDDDVTVSHWMDRHDPLDDLWLTLSIDGSWTRRTLVTGLSWSPGHGWRYNRLTGGIDTTWFPAELPPTAWTAAQVASELNILATRHPMGAKA